MGADSPDWDHHPTGFDSIRGGLDLVAATVVFTLVMVAVGPLFVIWAMNNLFTMGLEYSFINWLSVVILTATIKTTVNINKEKS